MLIDLLIVVPDVAKIPHLPVTATRDQDKQMALTLAGNSGFAHMRVYSLMHDHHLFACSGGPRNQM